MARPYQKKNQDYWNSLSQAKNSVVPEQAQAAFIPESFSDFKSNFSEVSIASTREVDSGSARSSRINRSAITNKPDRFSQIRQMTMPYCYGSNSVDIRDAVKLCQLAYANVPVFRNAIDLMSEFANTNIYLEGGTKASRDFFVRWFKRVGMNNLKDQFFRECYRSSNTFMYRVDGKFSLEDFAKLSSIYAADGETITQEIPLKYIILSPYDMVAKSISVFSNNSYNKVLSDKELARLKNPTNAEDKELFNALPEKLKKQIQDGVWGSDGISIELDSAKLFYVPLKKQDYEPFAVPFGYPVLDDINAKIEMKRMDQALMRTVEAAILHVKHGEKKDQHGGGINQQVGQALKEIFSNGTTGRTIVTDYTVSSEFVIPDLQKVLGPDKYQILNEDIREGLQNVIIGEEKYGNTQTKVQVFLDKLKESRNAFLEFLNPEIKRISKGLGFKSYPVAKFSDTEIKNNAEMMRVAVRLAELGILEPESLLDTINNGDFPNIVDIKTRQEEFVNERKKGMWNPTSPVATIAAPAPKLDPNKAQSQSNPGSPKKSKVMTQSGRPQGSKASMESLKTIARQASTFQTDLELILAAEYNVSTLSDDQKDIAQQLAKKVIAAVDPENWESLAKECIADPNKMLSLQPVEEVATLAAESDLGDFESALYYWASL